MFAVFLASALLITCTSFGVPRAAAEPTPEKLVYTVRGLGTLGGTQSIARDINDSGQVVGQSQNASGENRGFYWEEGQGIKPIDALGGPTSPARGINKDGKVVGFSRISRLNTDTRVRAYDAQNGLPTSLGTLTGLSNDGTRIEFSNSEAWHINDHGVAVGRSFNSAIEGRAVLWENGALTNVGGDYLKTPYSEAWSINNNDQVVGEAGAADQKAKAFLFDNNTNEVTNIDASIDHSVFPYSEAMGINDHGQVVGWSYRVQNPDPEGRAFLYEKNEDGTATAQSLDPLEGHAYSRARDIDEPDEPDESGRIVGWSRGTIGTDREKFSATIWEDGEVTDLNKLIPASSRWRRNEKGEIEGWKLVDAYAINKSGQIVGSAYKDGKEEPNQIQAFLLTPDTTAPKINCGTADTVWHSEDVPISCTASDNGVGLADPADASFTLTTSVEAGTETDDAQTGTREVCDAADNCATAGPVGGNMVDKKAPDTTSSSGSYNEGDWTNQTVTVTLDATDGGSGVQGTEYDLDDAGNLPYEGGGILVSGEGPHEISYKSTDNVGNVESPAKNFSVNIDNTSPEITGSRTPASNANGWNDTDVTVHFACSDALSGLASDCPADVVLGEGQGQSVTRDISDEAGNSASATVGDINVDETAPTVDVTGVSDGATYILGSVPVADCSTTDGLSGVDRQATLDVTGGPLGSITATCDGATDRAGNPGSASVTYNVIYDFDGFFSPVDNVPVLNLAKAGSGIPLKFSLGGNQGLDIFAEENGSSFPKSGPIPCGSKAPVDAVEQTVTATSSGLTYDATTGLYTYVWKTRRDWTGCRQLVVKLDDGKEYRANFEFF